MNLQLIIDALSPDTLPNLPLEQKNEFPLLRGIYFVFKENALLYIGKADQSFRQRWKHHHRLEQLTEIKGTRVFFLALDCRPSKLEQLEKRAIKKFSPQLNGRKLTTSASVDSELKRFSVRLPSWHYKRLIWLARARGQSVSGMAERIAIEECEANEPLIESMIADKAEDLGLTVEKVKRQWLQDAKYNPADYNDTGEGG